MVRAAAEVFRSWGARHVFVAEGPGHCRDALLVLEQSGLGEVLDESRLEFVDLNHDEVEFVPNRLRQSSLPQLALPASLRRADLIVSLPKLKTHHWAGVTLSLKNLFGVMPGIVYGWPKNVLHYAGIGQSILDIAAAVRPHLAIVDGIVGMEGDGPIMGTPRRIGRSGHGNQPSGRRRDLRPVDADRSASAWDTWRPHRPGWARSPSGTSRSAARRSPRWPSRFNCVDQPWLARFARLETARVRLPCQDSDHPWSSSSRRLQSRLSLTAYP